MCKNKTLYKTKMTSLVDSSALLSSRLFSIFGNKPKFQWIRTLKFPTVKIRNASKKSKMEIVNVPPIVTIYRQALATFDKANRKDLSNNLNKLKSMMDRLRAEDLGFDKKLNTPDTWKSANKAPCTYIQVYQDDDVNMSIFVLKPGFKMPLHDHPHMHGLLKVISGAVKIRSFSEYPLKEEANAIKFAMKAKEAAKKLAQGLGQKRQLFAKVSSDTVCRENAATCILTPTISNYHEIEALEMPAAFFDILSPPYDTLIEDIGPRRCRYYKVENELSNNLVELKEVTVPDCFYCDQAPYLGPQLV